ncbi:STAS domain-containing protein [Bacilliculturomica massiliensis]|uniref:STAS domain-containing protein n=1 Tax=Bacilliculturomica massiliensis TaxID=1917867 RepID=UPI0010304A4E|nr:STAS domain-containing protein [Bacilliculturomica massiliensis]
MALQMKHDFSQEAGVWKVRVSGEVDVATAGGLRGLLADLFQEKQSDIVLDMSDLSYIDSTGLGVLIGAYGRMQESGHGIRVEHPRENIAKLLRITSLDRIFCAAEQTE